VALLIAHFDHREMERRREMRREGEGLGSESASTGTSGNESTNVNEPEESHRLSAIEKLIKSKPLSKYSKTFIIRDDPKLTLYDYMYRNIAMYFCIMRVIFTGVSDHLAYYDF